MKKILSLILKPFRFFKIHHYLTFVAIIAIGVFNFETTLDPKIQQLRQEKDIQESFDKWWQEERAQEFKNVGLTPDEKIKAQEFELYKERYKVENPTPIIEDRIEEMKGEFLEWWENQGGKEQYAAEHGSFPTDKQYEAELKKWINKYTDKFIRYRWAYIPSRGNTESLLTCSLLIPSIWSFIFFVVIFMFTLMQLEKRWNALFVYAYAIVIAIISGFFVDLLVNTSFFAQFATERYMGVSLMLCFLLGANTFDKEKGSIPSYICKISEFALVASMAIDWFLNPGIFNAVAVESPFFFALGGVAGYFMPHRVEESTQQATAVAQKAEDSVAPGERTRNMISKGLEAANNGENENAVRLLQYGFTALLKEEPIKFQDVKDAANKIAGCYAEFPSTQWIEWGATAKQKNIPEAAIALLEKGITKEKDENLLRRAHFDIAELRIQTKADVNAAMEHLEKVIKEKDDDKLAEQAKKLMEEGRDILVKQAYAGPKKFKVTN
ncbi:hypothetical protein [Fibrobacter sp. UWB12]|uniref:hypothetical protein n=1 Tax=Fibrobacter sp. UWB12 TaxID=1896203 RepID=UPI0009160F79|nr:hypothetical protein [Fibrobacter sp. UWB12]SHK89016.1 hypothetical protein SAMN05720759_10897 [Fibrobacter sp. UWB12]